MNTEGNNAPISRHTWDTVRTALDARRQAIQKDITSYRSPIPACDVDFNDLLNERGLITEEIGRLDATRATISAETQPREALQRYVDSIPAIIRRLVPDLPGDDACQSVSAPADA